MSSIFEKNNQKKMLVLIFQRMVVSNGNICEIAIIHSLFVRLIFTVKISPMKVSIITENFLHVIRSKNTENTQKLAPNNIKKMEAKTSTSQQLEAEEKRE